MSGIVELFGGWEIIIRGLMFICGLVLGYQWGFNNAQPDYIITNPMLSGFDTLNKDQKQEARIIFESYLKELEE